MRQIGVIMLFLAMPAGLLVSLASEVASPVACVSMLLGGLAVYLWCNVLADWLEDRGETVAAEAYRNFGDAAAGEPGFSDGSGYGDVAGDGYGYGDVAGDGDGYGHG